MKPQHIGLLFFVGFGVFGWAATAVSADEKTICQTYGGSFALDDADFKALGPRGITRENFATLEPQQRAAICDSRKVWRLIKDGKLDNCNFDHYAEWSAMYFDPSERSDAIRAIARIPTLDKKCR